MKIGIVSAIYITNERHYELAVKSLQTFKDSRHEIINIGVVNKLNPEYEDIEQYYYHMIDNDENCLASAWNKGIDWALALECDYVIVANLDVELDPNCIDNFVVGATYTQDAIMWVGHIKNETYYGEEHPNDFSLFMLNSKTIKTIGKFDERFKPAYYEDLEFKSRIRHKGYHYTRIIGATYLHHGQQTVKNDNEIGDIVGAMWAKNEALYHEIISNY